MDWHGGLSFLQFKTILNMMLPRACQTLVSSQEMREERRPCGGGFAQARPGRRAHHFIHIPLIKANHMLLVRCKENSKGKNLQLRSQFPAKNSMEKKSVVASQSCLPLPVSLALNYPSPSSQTQYALSISPRQATQ